MGQGQHVQRGARLHAAAASTLAVAGAMMECAVSNTFVGHKVAEPCSYVQKQAG